MADQVKFRLLQPVQTPPQKQPPNPLASTRDLPKKTTRVATPGDPCRRRRTKCDGRRPICASCETRSEDCVFTPSEASISTLKRRYDDLDEEMAQVRSSNATFNELMDLIRYRDVSDANAIVQRLRAGADVESIVKSVREGDVLLELHVMPETRFRYSFPFQKQMPCFLQTHATRYLSTNLYEPTAELAGMATDAKDIMSPLPNEQTRPQFFKPYQAAKLIDPKLDAIKPSQWTSVSDDDNLMRALIRLYYQHEHHFLTCLHMNAFLDDMLAGQDRFCSPVLVNAVLAHACHCHLGYEGRYEHWNPRNLGYRFFSEAKRLFDEQLETTRSITNVQASMVINIILNMHSLDKLGTTYALHGIAIAHNMELLEKPAKRRSRRVQRGYDFTAWQLYWWESLECFHFFQDPWIREPPKTSMPDPNDDPEWYGEIWAQYPSSPTPVPLFHGHVCKARGDLALIINALAARLYKAKDSSGDGASTPTSLETAIEFSQKLTDWHSSLPPCLAASEIVFPAQLELHSTYHSLVMNICELARSSTDEASSSPTALAKKQELELMLADSACCFEALVRLYYLRHGYEYANTYLTHQLTVLAFMAFAKLAAAAPTTEAGDPPPESSEPNDIDDTRSTLILATKGIHDQSKNYYTSLTLVHLLLSRMSEQDRNVLFKWVDIPVETTKLTKERAQYMRAQYPIGVVNIASHPESDRLGNLFKQYAELAIDAHSIAEIGEETDLASS